MQISLPPTTWAQITSLLELALSLDLVPSARDDLTEALSVLHDELDLEAERQFLDRLTNQR